ncbi:MAG: YfhO family protein [Chloroflexi bacterium]|nr:YfhO family protein [Chloroflexota bacterium]
MNRAVLPAGTTVTTEQISPLHTRYHISGAEDFLLRLFLFQFPGWRAQVDGATVETELGRPEGFIVVPVPAGEHVVDVAFGSTPPRTWGTAVSWLSLALLLAVAVYLWRQPSYEPVLNKPTRLFVFDKVVLGLVAGITAVFILIIAPSGWLRFESSGLAAESAQTAVFADFGEQIALIGYDAPTQPVQAGRRWR